MQHEILSTGPGAPQKIQLKFQPFRLVHKNLPTQIPKIPKNHAGSKGLDKFSQKKKCWSGRKGSKLGFTKSFLRWCSYQFLVFKCLRVDPRTQGLEKYLCCFLLWKTNREEENSEHSKHLCNSWFLILFSSSRFPIEKILGTCWIPKQLETASFQSPAYLSVKTEPLVLECSWFGASKFEDMWCTPDLGIIS